MRINKAQLEYQVEMINEMVGNKRKPYENGKSNIGTYTIDYSYGVCKLEQIVNNCGGVVEITHSRLTKRELYYVLHAILTLRRSMFRTKAQIMIVGVDIDKKTRNLH